MSNDPARAQRVVVAAFLHDRQEVLLARRAASKAIAPGKYHLPGGHVEYGEHPADALRRELREELNIEVVVQEPLWVFHYLWGPHHTVGVVFRVPLPGERSSLTWDTSDLDECLWVPEEALRAFLTQEDYNLQAALAGFERLRQFEQSSN
jgi:8-oxo-dGTP diphosphatase